MFIIVCNNTNVSKLVFDYIAGWDKSLPSEERVVVPGELPLFSNEQRGAWSARPNTEPITASSTAAATSKPNVCCPFVRPKRSRSSMTSSRMSERFKPALFAL